MMRRFATIYHRSRGFSFIEVLFAVILLGIGFIMIAGIFPVAIEQSTATVNETAGQLVCRDAIRQIQNAALSPGGYTLFPINTTPTQVQISVALHQALSGNSFFSADGRYGWVAFYQRSTTNQPYAQIFVIALENPNFLKYYTSPTTGNYALASPPIPIPSSTTGNATNTYGTAPTPAMANAILTATFAYSQSTGNSYVYLSNPAASTGDPAPNACTGAYVLVANDAGAGNTPTGGLIGRFFRLGQSIDYGSFGSVAPTDVKPAPPTGATVNPDIFQLQPGLDLKDFNEETGGGTATVFIMGRAPAYDAVNQNYDLQFTGPNQDIAAMSALIRVNTNDD